MRIDYQIRLAVVRDARTVASLLALVILFGMASGCAVLEGPRAAAPPPGNDISGLWLGQTLVTPCSTMTNTDGGRCNAINDVTFLLFQQGSHLTGSYTCKTGNMICRNGGADDSGYLVSGSLAGRRLAFTVMIPADVTSCNFRGHLIASDRVAGLYECVAGGGIVDAGQWRAQRDDSGGKYPNP